MASTSSHQISSSSTASPTLWDVFLSFRGLDTRNTFTDHLYNALHRTGIRTFKDDPELLSGEVISRALPQAIQESKTYIVVLSENYASSPWCLEELVEILNCYKGMKRLVIPVFYYIDPYVVRHQLESFKEAFEKHQSRFDSEKVTRWRLTLNEVAGFSGYHISQNRSQADIVDQVVKRVLLETNPITLKVAKYPVGLDSRVEGLTTLFNSDTKGVIRIGLHGMGGVGKTTLAKAVYNQNYQRFQGSSFLANVREVSKTEQGLVCLQQQLLADVLKCNNINIGNVDQGIELIRERICKRKVLIVIDDLDYPKPLEYLEGSFASGSVVIMTTRNEDLLDRINVKARYKVEKLDIIESHQLFTQHAFGGNTITFPELSKVILERAGGLPLALQVFGSNLFNESEEGWIWFIDKLNRVPIDDVEKSLMISYDALKSVHPFLQDIFLDIACFYIGRGKEEAVKIMETCYTCVNRNIDILMKRCLITINEWGGLGMHDLLRDMGRKIARNDSPDEPERHSRLWESEDIDSVLKKQQGTEAIQGIISGFSKYYEYKDKEVTYAAKSFKRMSRLRFLYLNSVNLTGSFEQTFKDLRWLLWVYCPMTCLPPEFLPHKLVILELPHSNMRTMWELNMVFQKLKTLDMRKSPNLTTTPDFANFPCLETLNLSGCSSLKEVHISIGSLLKLVSLDLQGCTNLRGLPDSICSLRTLEVLYISCCEKLVELPDQLGKITSLRKLHARGATQLKMIPDISQLSNMEDLDLRECNHLLSIVELPPNLKQINAINCISLERLPNLSNLKKLVNLNLTDCRSLTTTPDFTIGSLERLVSLDLSYCTDLRSLPDNICSLRALEVLDISRCEKLEELPDQLGNIESLKVLQASGRSVSKLPDSIGRLSNLVGLYLCDNMKIKTLPDSICNLRSLEVLDISRCENLEELPDQLGKITSLRKLHARGATQLKMIPDISQLSNMEDLDLRECNHLLSIVELPPNLKQINAINCISLERLLNLSNLKKLVNLNLTDCRSLTTTPDFTRLPCLETLNLSGCTSLKEVHVSIGSLVRLVSLNLKDCSNLRSLSDSICSLRALEVLNISYCEKLEELPDQLGNIESLKVLEASRTSVSKLPDSIGRLSNLVELKLRGNMYIKTLPDSICNLRSLEVLNISCCENLEELPDQLGKITSLRELGARGATKLKMIPDISQLSYIEDLRLRDCYHLLSIVELPPNLKQIDAINCSSLERLPNLSNLKKLVNLNLTNCRSLTTTPDFTIGSLERLVSLDLSYCTDLRSLPDNICSLRALEVLDISRCEKLEELPDQLGNIESLKVLQASGRSVSKLPDSIGRLSNLVGLYLCDNMKIKTLPDSICNLRSLEVLDISRCENLEELPDQLGKITSLRELGARGATKLKMIPDISRLSNIEDLNLDGCHHLVSIVELPPNLKKLKAGYCWSVKRLPNLSNLKHLEVLDLGGCSSLEGILDVSNLKHLEKLDLTGCTDFTEIHGFDELTSLRNLFLKGCNSSIVASIMTKSCLEMCCGFQLEVEIHVESETMPNWISESSKVRGSRISLNLQPNESHNILGIIFRFCEPHLFGAYWVKNMTSGLTWSSYYPCRYRYWWSVIVIVPSSILPIREDGHNCIEIAFDREISFGIHRR